MYQIEKDCCALSFLSYLYNERLNWRRFPRITINLSEYEVMFNPDTLLRTQCENALKNNKNKNLVSQDYVYDIVLRHIARNMSDSIYPVMFFKNAIGCNCFILKDVEKNALYVVFRGTDMLSDIIVDIRVANVKFKVEGLIDEPDVGVRSGFYDTTTYNEIHLQIIHQVKMIMKLHNMNHPTVYITGHSLGGASAVIFGLILRAYCSKNSIDCCIHIHTYGCPVLGDVKYTNYINKQLTDDFRITRVVTKRDIVPRLSSSLFDSTKYTHSGEKTLVILDKNKAKVKKTSDVLFEHITQRDIVESIDNHSVLYSQWLYP